MTPQQLYEFDRLGYLVIPNFLTREETLQLAKAADELEEHAANHVALAPRKMSPWNIEGHRSPDLGYHVQGEKADGKTMIIEDFWNANPAFHFLIGHAPTMDIINSVIQERPTINNSELRVRYPGNATGSHMGGPLSYKYRYAFTQGKIDCMMVRIIYFLHDVSNEQGAFSVVPATHKSNYPSPYGTYGDDEYGLIGLPVKAGDAIFFTENLRHGGLTNHSNQTRKTLHVGYGPSWMMSQNILTMDEPQYITEATRALLTDEQNNLLRAWAPIL